MSVISLIFITLKLLEFSTFTIYGKKLSKTKSTNSYWKLAIIPIITYALIEGLRFGRMVDWNLYYFRYKNLGLNMKLEDYEPIFEYLCHFIYNLGFSYSGFITIQCAFLIFSILLFLSNHKEIIKWALPISLISIATNENFIRFYIGFSFALIGLYYLERVNISSSKRNIYAILFIIIGGLNHIGIYIFSILIFIKPYLNKYVFPYQYSIPILFIFTFLIELADLKFITYFTDILYKWGGSDYHGAHYLEQTDDLLSGTWGEMGYMARSLQRNIRTFIYCAIVFYFGKQYLNNKNNECFYYNLFVIGAIIDPLFSTIEIFNRLSGALVFMGCIACSTFYCQMPKYKKQKSIEYYAITICIIFMFYPYFHNIFFRDGDEKMMFIWDAIGREYIKWW